MPRVVIAGSFNIDHVWRVAALPQPGATLLGEYSTGPGGKGFNQAIAARRAGANTVFICALGDDPGAQWARQLCTHDQLQLHAALTAAPTGTAGIYVDAQGRNSIVIGAGANALLSPDFIDTALSSVFAGDVVLSQLESPLESVTRLLERGRAVGATTLLNPAPANVAIDRAMLSRVDVLTPNETEFAALLARHTGEKVDADKVTELGQSRLHELCRDLLPNGTVVITLGASGCFVSHAEAQLRNDSKNCYHVPAESAQVVDTTGAGDAFNGALAASLASKTTRVFAEHIQFATSYAARSTEHAGAALSMPYLSATPT